MSRTVRVTLTEPQAKCIIRALGVLEDEVGADWSAHPNTPPALINRTAARVHEALERGR